jgi:hypothetical protein
MVPNQRSDWSSDVCSSDLKQAEGLGPLNYEAQRGMLVHPTYAVTPQREPLGLINSWNWAREFRPQDGGTRVRQLRT